MPILPKAVVLSVPLAVFSGGSYYAYDAYWPKTIGQWFKMEGIKTMDYDQTDHWRAMFNDYGGEVDKLGMKNLTPTTPEEAALPLLKEWCKSSLNKPWTKDLREKMYKHCIYKPKTVKGWIMGSGKYKNFITEDEDYDTVFAVYREHSPLETPEAASAKKENTNTIEIGQGELKDWCETELNKDIEKSISRSGNYSIIFSICTKLGYKTVGEKINKTKPKWEMIEKDGKEKWISAFNTWKHTSYVLEEINKNSDEYEDSLIPTTTGEEGGPRMKAWCEAGMNKKLFEEDVYPREYIILMSVCGKIKKP